MSLEDIREYFSRHFLGRVKVHHSETAIPAPGVLALRRRVQTHPIRARMRVLSPSLLSLHGLECSNKGFRFATDLVQVKGARIRRYAPDELGVARVPLMRETSRPRNGLKRILMFPQERANRLQWQTYRPKAPGEMILAWYGPLIEGAIVKLALNKQRGTLLIWYNPMSRHFKPGGLYLYRRLGAGEKPEWRWI